MFVKCALTSLSVFGIPLSAFLMQDDQVQKPTRSQFCQKHASIPAA